MKPCLTKEQRGELNKEADLADLHAPIPPLTDQEVAPKQIHRADGKPAFSTPAKDALPPPRFGHRVPSCQPSYVISSEVSASLRGAILVADDLPRVLTQPTDRPIRPPPCFSRANIDLPQISTRSPIRPIRPPPTFSRLEAFSRPQTFAWVEVSGREDMRYRQLIAQDLC